MTKDQPSARCPNCASSIRHAVNYCDHCGYPVGRLEEFDGEEATGQGANIKQEEMVGEEAVQPGIDVDERPSPEREVGPVGAGGDGPVGEKAGIEGSAAETRQASFQERVASGLRILALWSGSPLLLLVIVLAAFARDNYRTESRQSELSAPEGSSEVVSREALGQEFLLNYVIPFLGEEKTAEFDLVRDSFERPRGVAVANGNVYVVDAGRGTLVVLDGDGLELAEISQSDRPFIEPVDVATDGAGNVYVLDAGDGGHVSVHSAAGDFLQAVPIPNNMADRSRGLDVDGQGRIWLAMTPALAVAAFDLSGQELVRISTDFEGTDLQPVDVAYKADGSVYVSTAGMTSVLHFNAGGELVNLWPLVTANSVDGPHLALDEEGILYVTQPEQGGVFRISGNRSEDLEAWALPGGQALRKLVGIAVSGTGDLFVTDSDNGNIYRLQVSP